MADRTLYLHDKPLVNGGSCMWCIAEIFLLRIVMGILLAAVIGVFLGKILSGRLASGSYTLAATFWGFGVFGSILVLAFSLVYVGYVFEGDQSRGGWTIAAMRAVALPIGVYAFVVFLGIWRSAANSSALAKILARYISLFFFSTAIAGAILGPINYAVMFLAYLISKKFLARRSPDLGARLS